MDKHIRFKPRRSRALWLAFLALTANAYALDGLAASTAGANASANLNVDKAGDNPAGKHRSHQTTAKNERVSTSGSNANSAATNNANDRIGSTNENPAGR